MASGGWRGIERRPKETQRNLKGEKKKTPASSSPQSREAHGPRCDAGCRIQGPSDSPLKLFSSRSLFLVVAEGNIRSRWTCPEKPKKKVAGKKQVGQVGR